MILRIVDKLWRLGKFAREAEKAQRLSESAAAVSSLINPAEIGQTADDLSDADYGEMSSAWKEEFVSWDYLPEVLPDRVEEIAKLQRDFRAAQQ